MPSERPAPPEPNTPNTGRIGKYRAVPIMPSKQERAKKNLAVGAAAAGFAAAVVIDIVLRVV